MFCCTQTFVNASGLLRQIIDFYKIDLSKTLVVLDLHLKFGDLRLRGGSHGGHNGLRDIERHCTWGIHAFALVLVSQRVQEPLRLGMYSVDLRHQNKQTSISLLAVKTVAQPGANRVCGMGFNGPLNPPPRGRSHTVQQPSVIKRQTSWRLMLMSMNHGKLALGFSLRLLCVEAKRLLTVACTNGVFAVSRYIPFHREPRHVDNDMEVGLCQ